MHQIDYAIVIPVRLESRRLPGKALLDLCGQTLIERAWRCARASRASEVVVATDHERIKRAAEAFGATVCMTRAEHPSGSDRIAECADLMGWTDDRLIVNLQGDEPLMPPECLDQVAGLLASDREAEVATLYWPVEHVEEVGDPNVVKLVVDDRGRALYFSRAGIPFPRDFRSAASALEAGMTWNRHLGLYAYRKSSLARFASTPPTPLEMAERLEQLRFIETGGKIAAAKACRFIPAGVDTAEDLERLRQLIQ